MPAAAIAVPLIGTALSTGLSGLQMAQANKQRKEAQDAINNFQRQDLVNPFAGLQVSTLGADRQREDLARTIASFGGMAALGGSRGIAGILPNLLEQQNAQEAQIAASLDQQQMDINKLQGQGEYYKMKMQEDRDIADLGGLGTQLDLAKANASAATNAFSGSLIGGLTNIASAGLGQMANGKTFFGQTKWGPPTSIPTGPMSGIQGFNMNNYLPNNFQLPNLNPKF